VEAMNRYKMEWHPGDTINTSIGQGYVLVTPIQMAVMTARLVTGKKVEPTLVLSDKPKELESLGISDEHIKIIREGMRKVTNEAGGTAFAHNMSYKDFIVGGKTGTAQVAALKFKHAAHKFMHHGLFTSFGPVDDPQYVVTVIVAHGEAGAKTAAPIAKQIYLKLLGQPTMLDPKEPVETDDVDNVNKMRRRLLGVCSGGIFARLRRLLAKITHTQWILRIQKNYGEQ
jgi:penicillin-binding protein 2